MKDENLIVGHSLLSNNDLFTPVDDKVASLIVHAVLASVHSVIVVKVMKLAELRPEHDWDLADHDSSRVVLTHDLLDLSSPLASLDVNLKLIPIKLLL